MPDDGDDAGRRARCDAGRAAPARGDDDDDDIFGSVLKLDEDRRREGYAQGMRDGELGRAAAGSSREMVEEAYQSGRRLGAHAGQCIHGVALLVARAKLAGMRDADARAPSRGGGDVDGDGAAVLASVERMLVAASRRAARPPRGGGGGAELEDAVMALLMSGDLIRLYRDAGEPVPDAIHEWRSAQRSHRHRQHADGAAGGGSLEW